MPLSGRDQLLPQILSSLLRPTALRFSYGPLQLIYTASPCLAENTLSNAAKCEVEEGRQGTPGRAGCTLTQCRWLWKGFAGASVTLYVETQMLHLVLNILFKNWGCVQHINADGQDELQKQFKKHLRSKSHIQSCTPKQDFHILCRYVFSTHIFFSISLSFSLSLGPVWKCLSPSAPTKHVRLCGLPPARASQIRQHDLEDIRG